MYKVPSLVVPKRKPMGRLRLKKGHPLYRNLIGFFPLNTAHQYEDLCGNFTHIHNATNSAIVRNNMVQNDTNNATKLWDYHSPEWTGDLTCAWGVHVGVNVNYNVGFGMSGGAGDTFNSHSSSSGLAYIGVDTGTRFTAASFYKNYTHHDVVYTTDSAADTQALWYNGYYKFSETTVTTPSRPTTMTTGSVAQANDQTWSYIAIWTRPVGDDIAQYLAFGGIWDMVEEVYASPFFELADPRNSLHKAIESLHPNRYYRMDETSGNVADSGTDGADGTKSGTITYRENSILPSTEGKSMGFSTSGYFATSNMSFGTSFTISFPFRLDGNPAALSTVWSQYDVASAAGGLIIGVGTDGKLHIDGKVPASFTYEGNTYTKNICDNAKHYCTVIIADNTITAVVDGEIDPVSSGDGAFNGTTYYNTGSDLGQVNATNFLLTDMQQVAIWRSALSVDQAKTLHRAAHHLAAPTSSAVTDIVMLRDPALLMPGRKPVVRVKPDDRHPLSKGLIGCWLFQHTIEGTNHAVNSAKVKKNNRNNYTDGLAHFMYHPSLGGCTVRGGYTGTDRVQLGSIVAGDPLSLTETGKFSVYQMGYFQGYVSSSRSPRVIDKSNGGTAGNGWGFWANFTAASNNKLGVGVNGVQVGVSSDLSDYIDDFRGIGVSCRSGAQAFYMDGVQHGTDTGTYTMPTTTTVGALLNWNHAAGRGWPGQVACIFVWDRELTPEEHEMLHHDRYQFLIPA